MAQQSGFAESPNLLFPAMARSAIGGWIAGCLFAPVDFLLALNRMPMRASVRDGELLLVGALIFLPVAGSLLGASFGFISHLVRRPRRGPSLEWAFFFVLRLFIVGYGASFFIFRFRKLQGSDLLALCLLIALLVFSGLAARRARKSERRLPRSLQLSLFITWLGLFAVSLALPLFKRMPSSTPGPPEKLVLFITVDTLRADALGVYGNDQARTPNIDAMGREGAVFLRAQAAASWTLPSHASMFTGLNARQHGANIGTMRISRTVPMITEALRDQGYRTAGFVSSMIVNSALGFGRGFSLFDDQFSWPWRYLALPSAIRKLAAYFPSLDPPVERRAGDTVRQVLPILDQGGSLFVWIHLMDPHTPYAPPAGFRPPASVIINPPFDGTVGPLRDVNLGHLAPPRPTDVSNLRALYDGEVAYTDSEIGRLLGEIKRRGLEKRTSILLTADHGEGFGEHERFLHQSLHQEILHVPFILWAPGRVPAGLRVQDVVRGIDVPATLADLAGVEWKSPAGDGRSVLPILPGSETSPRAARSDRDVLTETGDLIFPETSLLVWPWKFYRSSRTGMMLFNLGEDPGERIDRSREQPGLVAQMKAELERGDQPGPAGPRRTLDPETTRRLKSLGYLQ